MALAEYCDDGWQDRARKQAPVLIGLVAIMLLIATLSLGLARGVLTTAFIFLFSVLAAATARRYGAALSLHIQKRSITRLRSNARIQVAVIDQQRRRSPTLKHSVRESLRLAGYAILLGTALTAAVLAAGARVEGPGQKEGISLLALAISLVVMPLAAIPWAASWVLRSSRIRIIDPDTNATTRIKENIVLRVIAPSALFSVLLALARRIETTSAVAQLAAQFAMLAIGLLFLGVTSAVAVILIDIRGRERMYREVERAIRPEVVERYGPTEPSDEAQVMITQRTTEADLVGR